MNKLTFGAALFLTATLGCTPLLAKSAADPDEGGIGGTGHSDTRPDLPERPETPERVEHIERPESIDVRDDLHTQGIEDIVELPVETPVDIPEEKAASPNH